jgi:hypothetical protein
MSAESQSMSDPDYGRGLDQNDPYRRSIKPDYARGLDHAAPSGDRYSTDYARGLDDAERAKADESRPDFARGSRK